MENKAVPHPLPVPLSSKRLFAKAQTNKVKALEGGSRKSAPFQSERTVPLGFTESSHSHSRCPQPILLIGCHFLLVVGFSLPSAPAAVRTELWNSMGSRRPSESASIVPAAGQRPVWDKALLFLECALWST
ncbi:hypothetical protein N656DRAFT_777955 [Canariomyces notabilis]|uniref:Uncharacterized protein n=1 Tax=Canariomyces notabilis TaxID=2074819 RepID=A0AAN6TG84_9PEZI|nr:hypothetical protein N656DRAFT_777955 [Canariomyces arenarius]